MTAPARPRSSTRSRRRRTGGVALGLAALLSGGLVFAQNPPSLELRTAVPVPLGQPKDFPRTAAEDEVWLLYQDDKLLTARRKVEALLEDEPDSIVGHFVFGQILRRAEANLPRAMKHVGKARELYETRYSPNVANVSDTPWLLHRDILYAAQAIAGELERHEYRLELLAYHDSLYDPRLTAEHAWPLMLLGRFDEARRYAEKAIEARDEFQRSLGRNALCAIEGEAGDREQRYEACFAAFDSAAERARDDDPFAKPDALTSVTVHAYNASLAAMGVLRPDWAEDFAKQGATRLEFTPANPWRLLVRVYTDQARMSDAVEALRDMQAWRRKQPPNLRNQVRAETDAAFATVLLVAAETETGLRVIDRAIENPDRRGLTTSSAEQTLGAHALLRRALRRTHAELERERASWSGTAEAMRIRMAASERRLQDWADAERIRGVLQADDRLVSTFRPYVSGGLEPVPSWLLGELVPVLGAGVVDVVLDMAEEAEDSHRSDIEPYYVALRADVARHRGDEKETLELAERALEQLPEFEALLRARMAALAGEAALELDRLSAAFGFLATAMQLDAGIARRLGLALPATLRNRASGPVAAELAAMIEDSPRFDFGDDGGFEVTLEGSGQMIEVCLNEPAGGRLACATTPPDPAEAGTEGSSPARAFGGDFSHRDYAAWTAEAFHRQAFAMPVGLSNIDLGSLDGTATIADEANRERMRALLDKAKSDAD